MLQEQPIPRSVLRLEMNKLNRSVPHPFAFFANGWETTNLNQLCS
jgi:hypothetical protein